MIELTFSRAGSEDIVLTEDDLFDFRFERGCFSGDTFELGGVSAKSIYMIIDNNTQRFPRGAFANSRVRLDIDGHFCGYFNAELPKRRNGVIELTAYDDMIKLDVEFPQDHWFPQTFWAVYAQCLIEAGIADHYSVENGDIFVLNALFNVGVISHEYTDYIYANSCRNLVSGMAEWNGGFAYINDDGKLQVDVFSKEVSRTFYSGELMDFDYSDETVVFSKIKTSQKNKTYEMGDDSGYTLIINNQYIGYGLDDEDFEMYLGFIYDYYKDFSLTPMSFTLAEPDFSLKIGDRISVVDEEENVTVTGNISEISVSGNCSMTVTCGGFGNVSGVVNYNKTSTGQNNQTKAEASQASSENSASAITTYEYLTDNSVKFNDTTYTIEKNEAGLISKITDSLGNVLKPVVRGEITDAAFHNAVFMAVAMLSRFGREYEFMPYMSGVSCYYGRETMGKSEWRSMIKGGLSIRLSRASVTDDELIIAAGGSGIMDTNLSGNITIYVAAANTSAEDVWTQYAGMGNTKSQGNGRECTVQSRGTDSGILCTTGSWGVDGVGNLFPDTRIKSITDYHLVVMRREGSTAEAFFDGVKASASKAVYDYSPTFFMGGYYRGGQLTSNGAAVKYKFVAISNIAQTDSEILENSRWLMERLNISQQNAVQDVV